jgi:hypothetical protein
VQQAVATWTGTQQFLKENAADRVAGLRDKLAQTTQAIQAQTNVWKSLAARRRRAAIQAQKARETLAQAKVAGPVKTGRASAVKLNAKVPALSVRQLNGPWKESRITQEITVGKMSAMATSFQRAMVPVIRRSFPHMRQP